MTRAEPVTQLRAFYRKQRRMPSIGELCDVLGYKSKGAAHYRADRLIEQGILQRDKTLGLLLPGPRSSSTPWRA